MLMGTNPRDQIALSSKQKSLREKAWSLPAQNSAANCLALSRRHLCLEVKSFLSRGLVSIIKIKVVVLFPCAKIR